MLISVTVGLLHKMKAHSLHFLVLRWKLDCRSRLSKLVMDSKASPYIVVLPYGLKVDLMKWAVDGKNLVSQLQQITYTLRAYAVQNPRSYNGQSIYADLGPSINQVFEIKKMVASRRQHIFAYFCLQGKCMYPVHVGGHIWAGCDLNWICYYYLSHTGSQHCIKTGYKVVNELLSVMRTTDVGKNFGARVVVHKPENSQPFNVISKIIYYLIEIRRCTLCFCS